MKFKLISSLTEKNKHRSTGTEAIYELSITGSGDLKTMEYVQDQLMNHKYEKDS